MIVKDCITFKIRYIVRSLYYSKNINVSTKFYDNLISYDSQIVHDCISESVEKSIERKQW